MDVVMKMETPFRKDIRYYKITIKYSIEFRISMWKWLRIWKSKLDKLRNYNEVSAGGTSMNRLKQESQWMWTIDRMLLY